MASEKEKDVAWGRRLQSLRLGKGLSQKKLASAEIDLSLPTIQRYESGELPGGKGISEIVKFFKCNKAWLLSGEGVPFPDRPGAQQEKSAMPLEERLPEYNEGGVQKINIEEAIGKAYIILRSRTRYALALDLNIAQFADALEMGASLKTCHDEIAELKTQVGKLQEQVTRLSAVPGIAAASGDSTD
jgi:transcriptional regulator with XRE-family HTH domain